MKKLFTYSLKIETNLHTQERKHPRNKLARKGGGGGKE